MDYSVFGSMSIVGVGSIQIKKKTLFFAHGRFLWYNIYTAPLRKYYTEIVSPCDHFACVNFGKIAHG